MITDHDLLTDIKPLDTDITDDFLLISALFYKKKTNLRDRGYHLILKSTEVLEEK
jgi:hypothetical protein